MPERDARASGQRERLRAVAEHPYLVALRRRRVDPVDGTERHEVHAALPDPPSTTAVRTLLRILENKGHLSHFQDGPRYVYRAVRSRERVGRSSLKRVLDTFFGGSLERAVAAHLADSAAGLSPNELKRLSQLINQARKKER